MDDASDIPLADWRELPPAQRAAWWEALWRSVTSLSDRYRLALRSGWWQDSLQVEALAAFCAWLRLYDTGAYVDPPGKLQLLWELDRLRAVTRAGERPFEPAGDRSAFERYLANLRSPPLSDTLEDERNNSDRLTEERAQLAAELEAVTKRVTELTERKQLIAAQRERSRTHGTFTPQAQLELEELGRTIEQLARRADELRNQLHESMQSD